MSTQRFDRSAIMKRAHQLRRMQGLTMSTAMKLAWAEEKGMALARKLPEFGKIVATAQETGVAGFMHRYRLDKLAGRARAFVDRLQAGLRRQARLPAYFGRAVEARRDSEGTYWAP